MNLIFNPFSLSQQNKGYKKGNSVIPGSRGSKSSHLSENHPGTSFALFFGRAWHQMDQKGQNDQNPIFWAEFGRFWAKILIFMGVSKRFGTNITENHLDNLSASFFGQAIDQMGQKCRYLAQNAGFGPNLAVFGPKIQYLGAGSKNFGTLISGF